MVYFYVHNIIKLVLSFQTTLIFNFIRNKNLFILNLKIIAPQDTRHIPFASDYL
jgi:hypothetical protein